MSLALNAIYEGDCLAGLAQIESERIDLAFADPPFNIGYDYDVYQDRRPAEDYLDWSRRWIAEVRRVLKPAGTFWLAIGDEYAAELKVLAQQVGFTCRSWVLWYYTFGVNCKRAFSRSHTHLLYFVKDAQQFTFNAEDPAVRVPSARQLVYADGRANPKGRLPDNTWILRPQDVPEGFAADHDTWYFPRVAGTFKEREGFHGCQMPEQLLGRIIRCCSRPGEIVLDPFGGSGTTAVVAKKLDRQWIGFELSQEYATKIRARLAKAAVGDPLDGAADPLSSAPATLAEDPAEVPIDGAGRRRRGRRRRPAVAAAAAPPVAEPPAAAPAAAEPAATAPAAALSSVPAVPSPPVRGLVEGIIEAYQKSHRGLSVDHVLTDPELNAAFVNECRRGDLPGKPGQWNLALLRIRKAGRLPRLQSRVRSLTHAEMDPYSFAAEIALGQIGAAFGVTLDEMFCEPRLVARFDALAARFAPGYTPFQYRWAALSLRKRAKMAKLAAQQRYAEFCGVALPAPAPIDRVDWASYPCAGVYVVLDQEQKPLYVGETLDLRRRIDPIGNCPAWRNFGPADVQILAVEKANGLQSFLISRLNPPLNASLLAPVSEQ